MFFECSKIKQSVEFHSFLNRYLLFVNQHDNYFIINQIDKNIMFLHIVNDHIRCRVINLRPLSGMQLLGRPIDGKSDVTTRRMPIRIGKS